MKSKNFLLLAVIAVLLSACNTSKDIPYMTNVDQISSAALSAAVSQAGDFSIKPGDMLMINVSASTPEAVVPFNKIGYLPTAGKSSGSSYNATGSDYSQVYYIVDDNGNIDFPVLGKLHISGMTKASLQDYIASLIYPRYLTERPGVEVRIQNFKVYCIGEFNSPGVIQATNGRLNFIEAVAMCGDLSLYGKRDNILLIRTDATGQRTVKRINMNDANFLTMPEFNLQQNDMIYVEPNASKARSSWSVPPAYSFGISLLSTLFSIITFVTVLAK